MKIEIYCDEVRKYEMFNFYLNAAVGSAEVRQNIV